VFRAEGERWRDFLPGAWVKSVTQEHGIVHLEPEDLGRLRIGDLLVLCPVHSCLAADLLRSETVLL
jgi:D-serine deaminase-like pyridoxal phosphate-dependent protein